MIDLGSVRLPVFSFGSPNICTYCGDLVGGRDHVIAVSYQSTSRKNADALNGPWCWACRDCNSHLSNRYFDSFKARCEWAQWRLSLKAVPVEWHDWQIAEFDYSIRTHIQSENEKRKMWRARADFYQSRDFYLNLESLIWEVSQLRGGGIGSMFIAAYFDSMLRDVSSIYRPNSSHSND